MRQIDGFGLSSVKMLVISIFLSSDFFWSVYCCSNTFRLNRTLWISKVSESELSLTFFTFLISSILNVFFSRNNFITWYRLELCYQKVLNIFVLLDLGQETNSGVYQTFEFLSFFLRCWILFRVVLSSLLQSASKSRSEWYRNQLHPIFHIIQCVLIDEKVYKEFIVVCIMVNGLCCFFQE